MAALSVTGLELAPGADHLLRGLRAFEPRAWEALLEREMPRLFKFAYARTGDAAASEDIAAEVFEEAARRIGRYEERGLPLSAWLFRIARNLVADHHARLRRRPLLSLDAPAAQAVTS
jgi:RNA polymerase sigma-70 factor (ECF subfamily)